MYYRSFYFYKEYWELAKALPEEHRGEFITAIIRYGTEEDYSISVSDPLIESLFIQIRAQIDASVERYERYRSYGQQGGRPREIDRSRVMYYYNRDHVSIKNLAKIFRCSERTIQRIIKKENSVFGDTLFEMQKKKNLREVDEDLLDKIVYGKIDDEWDIMLKKDLARSAGVEGNPLDFL